MSDATRKVAGSVLTAVVAAIAGIVLLPQTAVAQANSADSTSASAIDAGRKIFHGDGNCLTCHGSNLEGTPIAPTLQVHAWKDAKTGDYRSIVTVVMNGVPGTAMIGHPGGISDAEVHNVAAYVWAVSHGRTKP